MGDNEQGSDAMLPADAQDKIVAQLDADAEALAAEDARVSASTPTDDPGEDYD